MPLSLSAISRRRFMQNSLAIAAAAALPGGVMAAAESVGAGADSTAALAAPSTTDDFVALLSDVHVSGSGGRAAAMGQRLQTAISQVLTMPQRPHKVLVAGDCAHLKGRAGDYREYIRRMQPLADAGLPVHMTLGNHDDRDAFWTAMPGSQPQAADQLQRQAMVVPGRRANWFMVDSLNRTNHGAGQLGADQLEWLAAELDRHDDKPALVMLHHNPDREGDRGSLKDSDHFLAITRARKQVKAVFFGHTHIWKVTRDRSGMHMVNLPATGYTLWMRSFIGWVDCALHEQGATLAVHTLKKEKENGQIVRLQWRAA